MRGRAVLGASAFLVAGCGTTSLDVLDPPTGGLDAEALEATAGMDAPSTPEAGPSGVGCEGTGSACTFAGECCSLSCGDAGGGGRACATGPRCGSTMATCAAGADCCSNLCAGGHCADPMMPHQPPPDAMPAPPPACKVAGEPCMENPECCGQSCAMGFCGLLPGCRVQGEVCGASTDCCSGLCALVGAAGQTVGHCAPLPPSPCAANDQKICMDLLGDTCKMNPDCCSRTCEPQAPGGPNRCARLSGCLPECELCASGSDCCSGVCSSAGENQSICVPATAGCGAEGELCEMTSDCCAGAACVAEPAPSGAKRCTTMPTDAGAGPD